MLPKVKEALANKIERRRHKEKLTWTTIQTVDIKSTWKNKNGDLCPSSWGTLYKIVTKPIHIMRENALIELLNFFGIDNNNNYGIVTLANTEDYEKQQ